MLHRSALTAKEKRLRKTWVSCCSTWTFFQQEAGLGDLWGYFLAYVILGFCDLWRSCSLHLMLQDSLWKETNIVHDKKKVHHYMVGTF